MTFWTQGDWQKQYIIFESNNNMTLHLNNLHQSILNIKISEAQESPDHTQKQKEYASQIDEASDSFEQKHALGQNDTPVWHSMFCKPERAELLVK